MVVLVDAITLPYLQKLPTLLTMLIVHVKVGDLSTKAGEWETRQKSVSLPLKAGELASLELSITGVWCHHVVNK